MSSTTSDLVKPQIRVGRSQVSLNVQHITPPSPPPSRQGPQTMLQRLQALFPNPPTPSPLPGEVNHVIPKSNIAPGSKLPLERFLKVRIVTWNMHDSLPKGNLEELLGVVPAYAATSSTDPSYVQYLDEGREHPYHIIVIAGQECPTPSGIPMGLGAGFNKFIERERDKEIERDRDDRPKEVKDEKGKDRNQPEPIEEIMDSAISMASSSSHKEKEVHHGWSAILEDYLCKGIGSIHGAKQESVAPSALSPSTPHDVNPYPAPSTPASGAPRKGAYELLVKERLMGIYMAVFVHRDVRHLIRGTSKSTVAAGLIGGRLGNKGGVGISLDVDGTTLLFINAHLAAHEGRAALRLANMAKIKSELNVDTFLPPNDPRNMAEDVTDRFDHTFICGDLNFRLDVTRLHADWLISRQEYAQAQAFDQLRGLMARGEAFVGFSEAPISFPPTFKFDVLRTLKKKKSFSKHKHSRNSRSVKHECILSEVEERGDAEEYEDMDGGDAASLASTTWTSVHSRYTTDVEDDQADALPSPADIIGAAVELRVLSAAQRAKAKWMSLLSGRFLPPPIGQQRHPKTISSLPSSRLHLNSNALTPPSPPLRLNLDAPSAPELRSPTNVKFPLLSPPLERASSTKTHIKQDEHDVGDKDRGVYDSSSKQRVPSWCDRILWKTTVDPGPDNEVNILSEEQQVRSQSRTNRMGNFLAQAFRPLRNRKDSTASTTSEYLTSGDSLQAQKATLASESNSTHPHDTQLLSSTPPHPHLGRGATDFRPRASLTVPIPSLALDPHAGRVRSFSESNSRGKSLKPSPSPIISPPSSPFPSFDSESDAISVPKVDNISTRRRWFSLFSWDPPSVPIQSPPTPKHRRGDVVCVTYDTLDDKGMRRLEGRSDHRPVIGVYRLYI